MAIGYLKNPLRGLNIVFQERSPMIYLFLFPTQCLFAVDSANQTMTK